MVLARVADFFTNRGSTSNLVDRHQRHDASALPRIESPAAVEEDEVDDEAARPPYLHVRGPSTNEQAVN